MIHQWVLQRIRLVGQILDPPFFFKPLNTILQFDSTEQYRVQGILSATCNTYCGTKGNCEGDSKTVRYVKRYSHCIVICNKLYRYMDGFAKC